MTPYTLREANLVKSKKLKICAEIQGMEKVAREAYDYTVTEPQRLHNAVDWCKFSVSLAFCQNGALVGVEMF